MTKPPNYLRRYKDLYRLVRREDGITYILTRHPDHEWGMTYDVYDYSDTLLAACLPPKAGHALLKRFPGTFTAHQSAGDGIVLLFEESRLHELADALKIRRRRRLSEKQKQEQVERLRRFQFTSAGESEITEPEPTISVGVGQDTRVKGIKAIQTAEGDLCHHWQTWQVT